ncbi:MAG: ArdC-like ssDNA-binding domain-containing protein [Lachnospiraceae bacterium]
MKNKKTTKDRQEVLKDLTEQLEKSIQDFMESEKYKTFLSSMAKFHNYSLNNQILIAVQKPDSTLCAGYTTWQKQNRYVKKGEKGIRIICPAPYKKEYLKDVIDKTTGKPELLPDGRTKQEIVQKVIPFFKVGYVYDISQTEGQPLPEIADILEGDLDEGLKSLKEAMLQVSPVPVCFQPIDGEANGFYSPAAGEIVVDSTLSEKQSLKTLIHETAHALLHNPETASSQSTRETKEVEAESVAYVVCQYFGLDTSDYSFGYIAGWSSGKGTPELKASLETIRETSNGIITKTEQILAAKTTLEQTVPQVLPEIHRGRCM